jgi:hypothetical protein
MELLDFPIEVPKYSHKVFVHVFGDIHRASLGCDAQQLRSDINQVKHANETREDESHYWIGLGDWHNAIGPKDRRHDAAAIATEFREYVGDDLFQREASTLVSEFEAIKQWGIGILTGNHEATIAKTGEFNPSIYVAERLNLPYLGYSALVRFTVRALNATRVYVVMAYCHHGTGASRTKGGKMNMLWNMRDVVDADVYVVGHVHELVDFPVARMAGTRKGAFRLKERELLFVNGGTYQKAYAAEKAQKGGFNPNRVVRPDYAEVKAYTPSIIGHNGWMMTQKHVTKISNRGPQWQTRLKRVDFRR